MQRVADERKERYRNEDDYKKSVTARVNLVNAIVKRLTTRGVCVQVAVRQALDALDNAQEEVSDDRP